MKYQKKILDMSQIINTIFSHTGKQTFKMMRDRESLGKVSYNATNRKF